MIDLTALASLRAVDEHGSVVAAARALGYTPSAVSQQVKRLEQQTGSVLLERVGRGVVLTHQGRYLAEEGVALLRGVEQVEAGLHGRAGVVEGHLRLATFSTATRGLVAPVVRQLLDTHPGLRLTVTEREPWDAVDLVAAGQVEIGLVHTWGDMPLTTPEHLVRTHVRHDVADVVLPRDHPLAGRALLRPHDLLEETWIATPEGTICREWLGRMFAGTGRLPRIDHVSIEFDSHLALVRAGLGVALVPRLGRQPLGPDLVGVGATDPEPTREVFAVHRRSMAASPSVRAVVEALQRA